MTQRHDTGRGMSLKKPRVGSGDSMAWLRYRAALAVPKAGDDRQTAWVRGVIALSVVQRAIKYQLLDNSEMFDLLNHPWFDRAVLNEEHDLSKSFAGGKLLGAARARTRISTSNTGR